MKKYFKNIIIGGCFLLGTLVISSCEEYLDIAPEAVIDEGEAFQNFTNFQGFTEELYHLVVNFTNNYWTNSWNWGDDEIACTAQNFHFIFRVDEGNFWGWQQEHDGWGAGWMDAGPRFDPTNTTGGDKGERDLWRASWHGIRKANLGLANMDKMIDATQEERDLIEGQLLFFRGWFHHRLMEYFGGLPYINRLLPAGEILRLPRLSYHETADLAALDFRAAADLLPIDWDYTVAGSRTQGHNDLRINRIMALGYLGKNYLWAASPLMNYSSTGVSEYHPEYARRAAAAFAELLGYVQRGETHHRLIEFANIHNNFYTTGQGWALPGAVEAIFRATYISAHASTWRTAQQYTPILIGEEGHIFVPTANYVDFYGMANGLPLDHPESGFDPEFPWRDRDPRFYTDIIFDGVQVVAAAIPLPGSPNDRFANLHTGGSFRAVSGGSRTGYLNRKFVPRTANRFDRGWDWGHSLNIQIPYMRLADVYLMYAEAAAVGHGGPQGQAPDFNMTAVDAINIIRDRAGVGRIAPEFTGSLEAFLPELRRERAVELAFEAHRFNDLRRWKLLIESPYTLKTAHEFDRAAPLNPALDPRNNRVVNFREVTILERNFTERHFWLPLKVEDVNIYPEFYQNPGW